MSKRFPAVDFAKSQFWLISVTVCSNIESSFAAKWKAGMENPTYLTVMW